MNKESIWRNPFEMGLFWSTTSFNSRIIIIIKVYIWFRSGKSCLVHHMVIPFRVVPVVVHCFAVYSPIACWPVPNSTRQISMYFIPEIENHLEPEIPPTIITNSWVNLELNLSWTNWRNLHDFSINHVNEIFLLDVLQYLVKDLFRGHLFGDKVISDRIEFNIIWS